MSVFKLWPNYSGTRQTAAALPAAQAQVSIGAVRRKRSDRQLRYLSQAVYLEEAGSPTALSRTALLACGCVAGFIGWAAFAQVNEVAHAPGAVVPSGLEQVVQHLDGGLVRTLSVRPGDLVNRDQILLTIDDGATTETLTRAAAKQQLLQLTVQRLEAQIGGSHPDFSSVTGASTIDVSAQSNLFESTVFDRRSKMHIIETQLAQKTNDMAILDAELASAQDGLGPAKRIHASRQELMDKRLIAYSTFARSEQEIIRINGDIERIREQRKRAEAAMREFNERLVSIRLAAHLEDTSALNEALAALKEADANLTILKNRQHRLALRSPVRGIIKAVNVNSIGSVLSPGQTVATIVPVGDELVVDAQVAPRDIGHIRPGQVAHIKISAFDFSKYGVAVGTVDHISATTFTTPDGQAYYKARIKLARSYVGQDSNGNRILPGMTVMADIKTGNKTILEYLLKPVQVARTTAFTEK